LLKEASKLGDVLIIGLNSDDSVRKIKGPARPINSLSDRAEVLSSIRYVDYIIAFEEETPRRLISLLLPDVLVKGGDYRKNEIVGADVVEAEGGKVVTIPLVEGKSTTKLIERIRNKV
ncbi:MAG: D-glycero-beta-D-manno-heptose 1-phosphate adenylyltransferase, partial [Candidatus Neomarinimicrobiota bacterium]